MKKILLIGLITLCTLSANATNLFNTLSEQDRKYVEDTIKFQQKLITCTPFEFSGSGNYLKIYGKENGKCHFVVKAGGASMQKDGAKETTAGVCDYKMPLNIAKQYANGSIKLTKAIYGLDDIKLKSGELEAISINLLNITQQYCK